MNTPIAPQGRGTPVKVLFVHQNFPGQFRRLALALRDDPGFAVSAIGKHGCPGLPGVRLASYRLHRAASKDTHHYVRAYEHAVLHGQAVLRLLLALRADGEQPDVIVAHPGWGETLFVKEVFPHARLIHFCEFFYHGSGADVGFDPEFPATLDDRARARSRNAPLQMALDLCDAAIAPTRWQKALHPAAYHPRIRVIHEGVDTAAMHPDADATFELPGGVVLRAGQPVVTYVARHLEPYRGFHTFMRALPALLAGHPDCQVVIAGGNGVSYGRAPHDAADWKARMLREVPIDSARVHFTGTLPFADYRRLLQVSAVHVYLTYPFVLSWSMLEAMACGCLLVGSDTAPVREAVQEGANGLLCDFFDHAALAERVLAVLRSPHDYAHLRAAARATALTGFGAADGT
ncbi:MAG: glycosyl transferase family 1, partial [Massilia sp.]|nr:glycosyl transferase family 1 [Massilia sp.]